MPRRFLLSALALALLARPIAGAAAAPAAGAGAAVSPPPVAPSAPGPGEDDLREALRDFYEHALVEDLGIPAAQVPALEPRIRDLLEAQRQAARQRADRTRQLWQVVQAPSPDPAGAADVVQRVQASERESMERVVAARMTFMKQLTPAQAVRFLAFEDRFRARVREIAVGHGGRGGRAFAGDRHGRPGGAPPPPLAPAGEQGAGAAPDAADGGRDQEAVETLELWFVHELRQRLQLPRDKMLDLLPDVDAFLDVQVRGLKDHREALRLARRADGEGADLAALVAHVQEVETALPGRLAEARERVTRQLSPVDAARFLLLEQRFWREAPRRFRALTAPGAPATPDAPPAGDEPR